MKKIIHICLFISSLFIAATAFAQTATPASLSPMLKKVMPAVVNLMTAGKLDLTKNPIIKERLQSLPKRQQQRLANYVFQAAGSGVIINAEKGIIVTNAHMIEQAQTIVVNLSDGRRYAAKVLGSDPQSDIAVLQIRAPHLTALSFGNSNQLKVGDFVVAIGSPFGLQQTVTSGIISSLNRSDLDINGYENFIQTDAPINEGNSGGALVDSEGKLIGVNTAILSSGDGGSIGIGFAIPSNMVKSITDQIIKYGNVKHGILGVMVQSLTPQMAAALSAPNAKGGLVSQVVDFTPARKAGLKVGDIITSINGVNIRNNGQIRALIGSMRTGSEVTINIIRKGKALTIKTKTGNPAHASLRQKLSNPFLYGLQLREVSGQTKELSHYRGVEILRASMNSLAWSMGLGRGDVIIAANGKPTPTIQTLDAITENSRGPVLLQVLQQGKSVFILLG